GDEGAHIKGRREAVHFQERFRRNPDDAGREEDHASHARSEADRENEFRCALGEEAGNFLESFGRAKPSKKRAFDDAPTVLSADEERDGVARENGDEREKDRLLQFENAGSGEYSAGDENDVGAERESDATAGEQRRESEIGGTAEEGR